MSNPWGNRGFDYKTGYNDALFNLSFHQGRRSRKALKDYKAGYKAGKKQGKHHE